jgi:hypothetical protein
MDYKAAINQLCGDSEAAAIPRTYSRRKLNAMCLRNGVKAIAVLLTTYLLIFKLE